MGDNLLSFEEWCVKRDNNYTYESDVVKRGVKQADKQFSYLWAQYEKYLDYEGKK